MSKDGYTKVWLCLKIAIPRNGYVKRWKYPGMVLPKDGNFQEWLCLKMEIPRNGCLNMEVHRTGYV